MQTYVNSGSQARYWPDLTTDGGGTLSLEPGQTADLDLPAGFSDPWLVPVKKTTKTPAASPEPAESADSPTT